jgi:hypothetical protein
MSRFSRFEIDFSIVLKIRSEQPDGSYRYSTKTITSDYCYNLHDDLATADVQGLDNQQTDAIDNNLHTVRYLAQMKENGCTVPNTTAVFPGFYCTGVAKPHTGSGPLTLPKSIKRIRCVSMICKPSWICIPLLASTYSICSVD